MAKKISDPHKLHPTLRAKSILVEDDLRHQGFEPYIVETLRLRATQQAYYQVGRDENGHVIRDGNGNIIGKPITNADGIIKLSQHQDPREGQLGVILESRAIDYSFKIPEGGYPPDNHPCWKALMLAGERYGLKSGGRWGDFPHLELKESNNV